MSRIFCTLFEKKMCLLTDLVDILDNIHIHKWKQKSDPAIWRLSHPDVLWFQFTPMISCYRFINWWKSAPRTVSENFMWKQHDKLIELPWLWNVSKSDVKVLLLCLPGWMSLCTHFDRSSITLRWAGRIMNKKCESYRSGNRKWCHSVASTIALQCFLACSVVYTGSYC